MIRGGFTVQTPKNQSWEGEAPTSMNEKREVASTTTAGLSSLFEGVYGWVTGPGLADRPYRKAFTLIELLAVIGIVGILAAMVVPQVFSSIEDARYASAIQSLRSYTTNIIKYRIRHGNLPSDWSDLGYSSPPKDPWGNEYIYLNHREIPRGKRRKDGPTVPINSDFDLFSPGPDGEWTSTIQAKKSIDDVIVAGDGDFIGRAEDY